MRHYFMLLWLHLVAAVKTVAIVYLSLDFLRWLVKYLARVLK